MADELAPSSGAPSTAASSTPAESSPAPASVAPTESTGSAAPATPTGEFGPVPYPRFKEVNDSLKAAKEWREQYGWAEQFQTQPADFVENWIDQLAQHPEFQSRIYAKAARLLQSRRGQAAPPAPVAEEPQADIPVLDGNGNVVNQTYSATQLRKWHDWNAAKQEATLAERFAPLEQTHQQLQAAQRRTEAEAQSVQQSKVLLTTLREDPYFAEHEPKVKAALIAHPEWGDDVKRAYMHVLTTEIIPTLKRTEQTTVLAHLKTQAAGSTVSPSGQTATQKPTFRKKDGTPDFGKAYAYYQEHPEERDAMANR